jgi:hypothetical protein
MYSNEVTTCATMHSNSPKNINILTWKFEIGCSLIISLVNHYKVL